MNTHKSIIEQTLNATRALINRSAFEEVVDGFYYTVDELNQRRLCKWLDFFNQQYYRNPCIYAHTVYALFEAVNTNELFKTQTAYEFEISSAFYETIFNAKTFISIENSVDAAYLLTVSLVLGKYPGMQIRSMNKAVGLLQNVVNEHKLNQFFECLFVKYENPLVLTYNLHRLDLIEIDILMYVLQGNTIRTHPDLPQPISKKESYILTLKVPYLKFEKDVLLRSIVTSKLILESNNTELLHYFYSSNKIFNYRIHTFYRDIDFWCDVYLFLLKVDWDDTEMSITDFVDYFVYVKYDTTETIILKGRSARSVIDEIDYWHNSAQFESLKEFIHLSWKGMDAKEYKIQSKQDTYLFKEITNGEDLYRESDEMKHCVFSYIHSCVNNFCSIWSMKKEVNTSFKHYMTIEVNDNEIVQISGKLNSAPSFEDENIIKEWAKEAGIGYLLVE